MTKPYLPSAVMATLAAILFAITTVLIESPEPFVLRYVYIGAGAIFALVALRCGTK